MTRRLSNASAGDLVDWSKNAVAWGVAWKSNPANHGNFQYWGNGVNQDWGISFHGTDISATGNGTFNHNCTQFTVAAAPTNFFMNSYTGAPFGSQTMGMNTITTTQMTVATGAGLAWRLRGRAG